MSKETEILHRISQARNQHNAPGTDELLKDCDIFIKDYGDLVDSYCTGKVEEMQLQIADMATKLTQYEGKITEMASKLSVVRDDRDRYRASHDERSLDVITIAKLRGEIEHLEAEIHELNSRIEVLKKPKRTRRTKAQMAKARSNEQSAKESENTESQPLH